LDCGSAPPSQRKMLVSGEDLISYYQYQVLLLGTGSVNVRQAAATVHGF
jgi:hypothetical protein